MAINSEFGWRGVIEGNDLTGKTTQVDMLADWIRDEYGRQVLVINEPDGPTEMPQRLRDIIKDGTIARSPKTNVLLFTGARVESFAYAEDFMNQGGIVLAARDKDSTDAYQGAGEGVPFEYIDQISKLSLPPRYFKPELKVYLSLEHMKRQARMAGREVTEKPDTFEMRAVDFQDRVNGFYFDNSVKENIPLINADQPRAAINMEIRELIWLRGLLPRR